jgi:hypothetical protein
MELTNKNKADKTCRLSFTSNVITAGNVESNKYDKDFDKSINIIQYYSKESK